MCLNAVMAEVCNERPTVGEDEERIACGSAVSLYPIEMHERVLFTI
jgi:hypothetical protein